MQKDFIFTQLSDMTVSMQTQEMKNMRLLRGRAFLCEEDKRLTFVQNKPREKRSLEINRSKHSRLVRRPDGNYTLTFRFSSEEKYLKETLISELRNVLKDVDK